MHKPLFLPRLYLLSFDGSFYTFSRESLMHFFNVLQKPVLSLLAAGVLTAAFNSQAAATPAMPFPQCKTFPGCIKPQISQDLMNSDIIKLYKGYKQSWMKSNHDW